MAPQCLLEFRNSFSYNNTIVIFFVILISFCFNLFGQSEPIIRGEQADISVMSFNSADLLDRGGTFVNSSFIKGAVNVSDYSGNLTIGHSMDINYPNDLKTKLTLIFNSNTSHAYFEDYVSNLSQRINNFETDLYSTGIGARENSVNAACWVFGINGIALQTTNFEKNFYLGSQENPDLEDETFLKGSQVPLLATGYQYTNDLNFPWTYPEASRLGVYLSSIPFLTTRDAIRIMNSEGSVLTLRNPIFKDNAFSINMTIDNHLKGIYFDADEKSNGYAIVQWMGETFGKRKIYYKPGDGLTYYFEEEYVSYQNYDQASEWGARHTNPPKIAYLKYIESPNGDRIVFTYDFNNIFGVNVTNGRKYLKKIQYYRNSSTQVTGTEITFNYIRSGNTFKIDIANSMSGENYTIKLLDNSQFTQSGGFNTLERNSTPTSTSIMQVEYIQNNDNTNKKVSFTYNNHTRKYTYGGLDALAFDYNAGIFPLSITNYYHLAYTTKVMASREVLNGEKNVFTHWIDTELDGTTQMYNVNNSYNFNPAVKPGCTYFAGQWYCSYDPIEFMNHEGYYINAYQNHPNRWWGYYRKYEGLQEWYRYFLSYHYKNMYNTMRDNYSALMIKEIDNKVWDGSQFKDISKKEYKYSWDHTLLAGTEDYPWYGDGSQSVRQKPIYDDLSPLITNIITEITTTNLDGASQYAANSSYTEKKNYEQLKVSSKFVPPTYGTYSIYLKPNIATELRIKEESTYDENGECIQSTKYNYKEDMEIIQKHVNGYAWSRHYEINHATDLSLISKKFIYSGVTKATILNTDVINEFGHYENPQLTDVFAETCLIRNKSQKTTTIQETYRTSSQSHNIMTIKQFNNDFAVYSSTNYINSNYIYKPELPEEISVYGQIDIWNWVRKSRKRLNYYPLTEAIGRKTNLKEEIIYGKTNDIFTKTDYDYYTTSPNIGYPITISDGKSTTTYQYNNQVSNTATGIVVPVAVSQYNYNQSWSNLQPKPFKTTKTFTSQYGNQMNYTTYTGYDGKGNLRFSVDENGYYSSNFYDPIGRITKSFIPGSYNPDITGPLNSNYTSAFRYGNIGYTYNDNLWVPEITKNSFRNPSGVNPITTKSYFLPSELAYVNSAIDGSEIIKSKEKLNYLGRKIYQEDGDGVKSYFLYDKYLNLSETRFISNSTSSPNKKQEVKYLNDNGLNDPTYFKRIKITDENGNYEYNYYDLYGDLIKNVKKIDAYTTATTSFAYDTLNRLSSVTSPEGKLTTYQYDDKGNISLKTTPDAGTTKYKYDKYGNLRFIQDANHPSTINSVGKSGNITSQTINGTFALTGKGRVDFGIPVSYVPTGCVIKIDIKTTGDVVVTSVSATSSNPTFSSSVYLPKGSYHYSIQATGTAGGYYNIYCSSNLAFVYNKYDNLNRIIESGEYYSTSSQAFSNADPSDANFPPSASCLINKKYFYDSPSSDPQAAGQHNLTGKLSYVEKYTYEYPGYSAFYSYDNLGRVEWMVEEHLGWYTKKIVYHYDLQGNITQKDFIDNDWRNNNFYTSYSYDNSGRMSTVKTKHGSESYVQEGLYSYYPSDKVKRLQLGNAQGVDYTYNNRGWLTMINHQNLSTSDDPGHDGPGGSGVPYVDKFGEVIGYNDIGHIGAAQSATAQYNGNISWLMYNMYGVNFPGGSSVVGYSFFYDKSNRMTSGDFGYWVNSGNGYWQTTNAYDEKGISYDKDGNFIYLDRYNQSGSNNHLMYTYQSGKNRLSSIFDPATSSSYTFGYDDNGNLVSDSHRGIAFILYDSDNLPIRIYKTSGESQFYTYDMNGNRTLKMIDGGSHIYYFNGIDGTTEAVCLLPYSSNFTYNILSTGGENIGQVRVQNNSVTGRYYYLKDHLGSIKMTVSSNGTPLSWDDYYPFGATMPNRSANNAGIDGRFKFTGKERDAAETGYDYFGARYYDSFIGRWLQVDPLAAKYPGWSPYNYTLNNPLIFMDEKGDSVSIITSGPTTQNTPTASPNSNGLAGHTAINVDGKVYSFEGNGKWSVYSLSDYMGNETKVRTTIQQTVDVDQEKVQNALDNRQDSKYDASTNSCVTNAMDVLSQGGIEFNKPNGAVTPEQLSDALQNSGHVTNSLRNVSLKGSSMEGMLLYKVLEMVVNKLSPSGIKFNTQPLIKK